MKDLHIHLERYPYDVATVDKMVSMAQKRGMDEINLLEHSIRIKEFHPTFKEAREYNSYQQKWFNGKENSAKSMQEYRAFIDEVRAIGYPVKVNFGLEVCWFEQHEEYIKDLLADDYFDIVLGSVHWIDNWTFNQRKYQWLGRDVDDIYRRYYDMSNSLIESGIFDIIAHPDLVRCHQLYPSFDLSNTYKTLCNNAKLKGVAIEMNTSKSLGVNTQFLDIAKEIGVEFSAGSDAHTIENIGKDIDKVYEMLKGFHIK